MRPDTRGIEARKCSTSRYLRAYLARHTMRRVLGSIISIVLILGIGLPLCWYLAQPEPAPAAPPRDLGPVPVRSLTVVARDLAREVQVRGNLEPARRVALRFERSGRLATVGTWAPGFRVEAGAVLATLAVERLEASLTSAHARRHEAEAAREATVASEQAARALQSTANQALEVATREETRLRNAAARGSVSESVVDGAIMNALAARRGLEEAEAALRQASAGLELGEARIEVAGAAIAALELELVKSTLRAPFTGLLVGRAPVVGSLVDPSLPLGELIDEAVVLRARLPELDRTDIHVGQSAQIELPALPETQGAETLTARVTALDPVADPRTRRALVELQIESESELPLGLFAVARIEAQIDESAVYLARRHLRWDGAEAYCFVLVDSDEGTVAERRALTFEREHGEGFVVTSGLSAGDRLLLEPLDRLEQGTRCRLLLGTELPGAELPGTER